eukprot:SAG11_NODE_9624_length_895_cov_1.222362_1_plen_123_part_00
MGDDENDARNIGQLILDMDEDQEHLVCGMMERTLAQRKSLDDLVSRSGRAERVYKKNLVVTAGQIETMLAKLEAGDAFSIIDACEYLNGAYDLFKQGPTLNNLTLTKDAQIAIIGDIHGQVL